MMNARQITPGQIKKIHTLVKALDFDDDLYRDILRSRFKATSSKELANYQAGQLIDELEEKAIHAGVWKQSAVNQKYKSLKERPGFASVPQLALIESIWVKVSRMKTPKLRAKSLQRFVSKIAKVSDLRFMDEAGAGKVIVALRQMEKNRETKKSQIQKLYVRGCVRIG